MKHCHLPLLLLALLPAAACSSTAGGSAPPPEENRVAEGFLPTPYTAEEIRAKCESGRTMVFRIESAGLPITYQVFHFTRDEQGQPIFQAWNEDADRTIVGEITSVTPDWVELQGHASFPEARTTVETADTKTPFGTFSCWVYAVRDEREGEDTIQRFHFARELPGPPVLVEMEAKGETYFLMKMIENLEI